jgi:methionyl-tRNA synthetase
VLTRYQRLKGAEAYFLTGVDQHGQKMVKTCRSRRRQRRPTLTKRKHEEIYPSVGKTRS